MAGIDATVEKENEMEEAIDIDAFMSILEEESYKNIIVEEIQDETLGDKCVNLKKYIYKFNKNEKPKESKKWTLKREGHWCQTAKVAYFLYKAKQIESIKLKKLDEDSEEDIRTYSLLGENDASVILKCNSTASANDNCCFKWEEDEDTEAVYIYLNLVDNKEKIPEIIELIRNEDENAFNGVKFEISKGENSMSDSNTVGKKIDEIIKDAINEYNQVIFTGAPGTGKTYGVKKVIEKLCEQDEKRMKFVQFHPSYDYSDFVEGLRPVQIETDTAPTFVRLDGIFKGFCRNIVEAGLEKAREKKEDTNIEEIFTLSTGKKDDQNKDAILNAFNNEEELYFFVVDEINRADLSKVFGELMFGLEESYRGIENRFDTQYMNLPTYEVKDGKASKMEKDCFENGFFIPKNLKFIGTMNDIDRSVESFDFALRRRFQWIDIKANEVMESSLTDMLPKYKDLIGPLADRIKAMNNELNNSGFGLSEAYYIGPAYFKNYDGNKESLKTIFNEKIEPIIREYTRGRDVNKVKDLVTKCRNNLLGNSEN